MSPISICLTSFQAKRGARWTEELTAREVRMLNVFLSGEEFERTRAAIVAALWPGTEKLVARKNAEVLVSRLRKKLTPLGVEIRHLGGSYKLVFD